MEAIGKEEHRRALLNIVRKSFWRSRAERETWNGREWGGKPKTCMYPGCDKPPIRSHVLQAARLKTIAGPAKEAPAARSVATLVWDIGRGAARIKDNVAIDNASVFPGFCSTHDTNVFRELEANSTVDPGVELSLQAYRSFCRELRKVDGEIEYNEQARQIAGEAQAHYLQPIFEAALPGGLALKYPELTNMMRTKGVGNSAFDKALRDKQRLREALSAMRQGVDNFIYNAGPSPFHFVELEMRHQLPLAL